MNTSHERRLALQQNPEILTGILRGIEKEGLRVDALGQLANTPHPQAIGSALTNGHITTDYAEALLELITEPQARVEDVLQELTDIHTFVAGKLDQEIIWNQSMPALLPAEKDIAIAWYGNSNTGMLKHVYRRGLAERYGKPMQCIAGVHYNFSLPDGIWPLLNVCGDNLQDQRSNGYLALIRNFTRYSWLLMYLFGASPVLDANFLQGRRNNLDKIDEDTLTMPWATSLRMSDLGYHNKEAQAELQLCYNDLDTFVMRMYHAAVTPWPDYEKLGTHRDGEWIQLNTHILQIENEYYSSIRPKRTTQRSERPATALAQRGVEYIEVRCLDLDPFSPVGVNRAQIDFLDLFLLDCLLSDSPRIGDAECDRLDDNYKSVVAQGRDPELTLCQGGHRTPVSDLAKALLDRLEPLAEQLDGWDSGQRYKTALAAQRESLAAGVPSKRVLDAMADSGLGHRDWVMAQSEAHQRQLREEGLSVEAQAEFDAMVSASLAEQAELEASDTEPFDRFLEHYLAS